MRLKRFVVWGEKQATSSSITVPTRFKVDRDAEVNHNLSGLQMDILGTQQGSSDREWLGNRGLFPYITTNKCYKWKPWEKLFVSIWTQILYKVV